MSNSSRTGGFTPRESRTTIYVLWTTLIVLALCLLIVLAPYVLKIWVLLKIGNALDRGGSAEIITTGAQGSHREEPVENEDTPFIVFNEEPAPEILAYVKGNNPYVLVITEIPILTTIRFEVSVKVALDVDDDGFVTRLVIVERKGERADVYFERRD